MVDRKHVADGLREALERADREFRTRIPGTFRRVDAIKRPPSWRPWWEEPVESVDPCRKCGSTDFRFPPGRARQCRQCANRIDRASQERRKRRGP